jgi:hypothetical protein
VTLVINSNFKITFGAGLARVLGANAGQIYSNTSINLPNTPQLENVKNVLVHCNLVYNEYQRDSALLYNFTPNSSHGSLLSIEPRFPQWRKTRESSEDIIEVWLTDQDGKVLKVEDDWGVILQVAEKDLISTNI